jgi:hypothetical protein
LTRAFLECVGHLSISGPISIGSEYNSDSSSSTEDLMEEKMIHQTTAMEAKKAMADCCIEKIPSKICLTQPRSLYFIHLLFLLKHIWISCFKKLCNCMVDNPFMLPVKIIKEVP